MSFKSFLAGYTDCALWCGVVAIDEDGNSTESQQWDEGDLVPDTLETFKAECRYFYDVNKDDIEKGSHKRKGFPRQEPWSPAGHDFWLTRNRHGAGFWDGDYIEPYAARLTEAAHVYGSADLYEGDDGMLYQQ